MAQSKAASIARQPGVLRDPSWHSTDQNCAKLLSKKFEPTHCITFLFLFAVKLNGSTNAAPKITTREVGIWKKKVSVLTSSLVFTTDLKVTQVSPINDIIRPVPRRTVSLCLGIVSSGCCGLLLPHVYYNIPRSSTSPADGAVAEEKTHECDRAAEPEEQRDQGCWDNRQAQP